MSGTVPELEDDGGARSGLIDSLRPCDTLFVSFKKRRSPGHTFLHRIFHLFIITVSS